MAFRFSAEDAAWRQEPHGDFAESYMQTVPATIGGGTSEIQCNIIAMRGLGLPRG